VHYSLSDYARALEYLGKALALHEELGDKVGVANWLTGNIGTVHRNFSDYARALEYYGKALSLHEELGNKSGVAVCLGNIGETYTKQDFDGCDPAKAEEFLLRAIAMNEDTRYERTEFQLNVFKGLSDLYETSERWKESREQFEKYHNLEKEVQSEEAKKKASLMEQQ
jgi:tetratricopeptide (TPR) repeat protein